MSSPITSFSRPTIPEIPAGKSAFITTSSPLPTPSYPDGNAMSWTIINRTTINAPASLVFEQILDIGNWGKWNTFVPACVVTTPSTSPTPYPDGLGGGKEGWIKKGDSMAMSINMSGLPLSSLTPSSIDKLMKNPEFVTVIAALDEEREEGRKGYRVCWEGKNAPPWVLRCERVQEVVEIGEGRCEWVTWESFGGFGAGVVRWTQGGKLESRFGDWGRDLKAWCEGLYEEQKSGPVVSEDGL